MRTQAKVALNKAEHPERYCKVHRCLWKVVQLDHATQTFHPRPDCPDGYCPRHRPVTLRSPLLGPSQYDRRQQERDGDRGNDPIEFSESKRGYLARDRWARRYDELNGAPENDGDR